MRDFLIELQAEYEQIAQYQIGRLEPGLSADEVVSCCREKAKHVVLLRQSTEKLLREYLYPMLDTGICLSEEDEADLYIAAQKFSSYETRIDPGLALRIYQGLLEWAREKQDADKTIKYLYWCGITLFFFYQEQHEEILAYFDEGAAYAGRYRTFKDPETRKYIHRCLGNKNMVLYSVNEPEKAMELEQEYFSFWNGLIFSGMDLDFPWLNYFLTCLMHKHSYITKKVHTDPDSESKEALSKILDTAIMINKLYHKNRASFQVFGGTRYDFILWEAQFLSGLISFDLLCENIGKKKAELAPGDFSADAMYVRIQLNAYLIFYAVKMQKLRERKDEIIAFAAKDTIAFFSSIPMSVNPQDVSEQVKLFATNLSDIFEPAEQLNFVMKMTTFRHIPTYAHSIMVGKIAQCLTEFLAARNPACFIGCMDILRAEDVGSRIGKLRHFAEIGGLCHDVGKISFITNPFLNTRALTKDEFDMVERHPGEGMLMFAREDGRSLNDGYTDVILGHHKHYDNSGGYPESFDIGKSTYRVMIDIIAVADSIDAATDDIGKMYADAKTLETVCAEIKAEAGKRYSPAVAGLLQDNSVSAALAQILAERADAYYAAYLHAWS